MTQEQIDAQIADWQAKLGLASENLLALDDSLAMKRIEGRGGYARQVLTGISATRVLPAVGVMRDLFGQMNTLSEIVEHAVRLRSSLNRLWRYGETLSQIERLLVGDSIPLPSVQTPLAQRSLLSSSTDAQNISPRQLLLAMTDAFAAARDAVLALEAAWNHWEPILDSLRSKEAALRAESGALALSIPLELADARLKLDQLQSRIAADPLGIGESEQRKIATLLSTALSTIESSRHARENATADLDSARALLATLGNLDETVTLSFATCREKLDATGVQPPVGVARLLELESWLQSLDAAALRGSWEALELGEARWRAAALELQTTLTQAARTNETLLALPAELRGRHAVVLARAARLALPDATLERLALQAKTLLDEPRIAVMRATKLIEACEARLRRAGGEGKVGE